MKTRTFYLLTAAGIACGLVAISAQGQSPSGSVAKRTIEVEQASVTLIDNVKVPAQEAGRLMKVNVRGGEAIDGGYVLAEIDNRDTMAKQKIAAAEIDIANAQAQSRAELEVAEKAVDVAKSEYEMSQEINKKSPGAVSVTELRKYLFQHERALAQVKVANDDLVVAGLTVKMKEAQLEATDNELARRQITAPFQGEVNEVYRQVGEWVQPGDPIAHIVRFDRLRIKGMVFANVASPVDVIGKPVEIIITTAGDKEKVVKGKIDFASSVIDGTGNYSSFKVWAEVENEKYVDPVTKKEAWTIQPGSMARMVIDLAPPAVKPVKAEPAKRGPAKAAPTPAGFRPRAALDAAGVTVEALKPVVPAETNNTSRER
jgi:multidrug resistance efflux pump